jgi:hypothetical protein
MSETWILNPKMYKNQKDRASLGYFYLNPGQHRTLLPLNLVEILKINLFLA